MHSRKNTKYSPLIIFIPNPSSFTYCNFNNQIILIDKWVCFTAAEGWDPLTLINRSAQQRQVPWWTSRSPQLTRVLGLEVGLALQRGWQVIEAERQLSFEGRVFLAESRESPERALTHQLLNGRVAARDGVRPARFWALHGGCRTLGWGGSARWQGWDGRGLVWRRNSGE